MKKCLDDLGYDVKRYTPRAMQSQISNAKNAPAHPGRVRRVRRRRRSRRSSPTCTASTTASCSRNNAMDFDDLLVKSVELLEQRQAIRDRYNATFRWVMVDEYQDTNHVQYRWLQLLTVRASQSGGGWRRFSVDLQLPRSRHPEHPRVRGRLSGRPRRQVGAELPLDADDPGRGERGHLAQPRADAEAPVDRCGRRRSRAGARAAGRPGRGAVGGGGDRATRRRGRAAVGDRRLLPHERAVARPPGPLDQPEHPVPGDRRPEVLRPGRGQGRHAVPGAAREPSGLDGVHAGRERSPPRDRADVAVTRARLRGDRGDHCLGSGGTARFPVWPNRPRRRSHGSCRR